MEWILVQRSVNWNILGAPMNRKVVGYNNIEDLTNTQLVFCSADGMGGVLHLSGNKYQAG